MKNMNKRNQNIARERVSSSTVGPRATKAPRAGAADLEGRKQVIKNEESTFQEELLDDLHTRKPKLHREPLFRFQIVQYDGKCKQEVMENHAS